MDKYSLKTPGFSLRDEWAAGNPGPFMRRDGKLTAVTTSETVEGFRRYVAGSVDPMFGKLKYFGSGHVHANGTPHPADIVGCVKTVDDEPFEDDELDLTCSRGDTRLQYLAKVRAQASRAVRRYVKHYHPKGSKIKFKFRDGAASGVVLSHQEAHFYVRTVRHGDIRVAYINVLDRRKAYAKRNDDSANG